MSDLVGNPNCWFSHAQAQMKISLIKYEHIPLTFKNMKNETNSILNTKVKTEPRREKTGLRGFRPGLTQTGLYKLRKELEA